eukprot:1137349-Pelagomonas_calceolata.AAC.1
MKEFLEEVMLKWKSSWQRLYYGGEALFDVLLMWDSKGLGTEGPLGFFSDAHGGTLAQRMRSSNVPVIAL